MRITVCRTSMYRVSCDLPISIDPYPKRLIGATLSRVGNPKLKLKLLAPQMADTLIDFKIAYM